jgi:hypothetical protein
MTFESGNVSAGNAGVGSLCDADVSARVKNTMAARLIHVAMRFIVPSFEPPMYG